MTLAADGRSPASACENRPWPRRSSSRRDRPSAGRRRGDRLRATPPHASSCGRGVCLEPGSVEPRSGEVRRGEVRRAQVGAAQIQPTQVAAVKVLLAKVSAELRASEHRARQVRVTQIGAAELRSGENRRAQIGVPEISLEELCAGEVGRTQHGIAEVRPIEHRVAHASFRELSLHQLLAGQIEAAQVASIEVDALQAVLNTQRHAQGLAFGDASRRRLALVVLNGLAMFDRELRTADRARDNHADEQAGAKVLVAVPVIGAAAPQRPTEHSQRHKQPDRGGDRRAGSHERRRAHRDADRHCTEQQEQQAFVAQDRLFTALSAGGIGRRTSHQPLRACDDHLLIHKFTLAEPAGAPTLSCAWTAVGLG